MSLQQDVKCRWEDDLPVSIPTERQVMHLQINTYLQGKHFNCSISLLK